MILLELKYLLENIKKSENKKEKKLEPEAHEKLKKLIPFDYQKLKEEHEKNMKKFYEILKEKDLLREEKLKPTEKITEILSAFSKEKLKEKEEKAIEKLEEKYKEQLRTPLSKIFRKRKKEE